MISNGFLLELIRRVDHLVDQDCSYIYTKRRVYYFSRRVPEDLKGHYKRNRVVLSLRTKSLKVAQARSVSFVAKLNEDWLTLRWRSTSDPFSRFMHDVKAASPIISSSPSLSEAKELYVKVKGEGRSKTFFQSADRSVGYMIKLLGDRIMLHVFTQPGPIADLTVQIAE